MINFYKTYDYALGRRVEDIDGNNNNMMIQNPILMISTA